MTYAHRALDLVREMKRTTDIPPYNDDEVRGVVREMEALVIERNRVVQSEAFELDRDLYQPAAWYYHLGLQRNNRCLLAYLNERLKRIRRLRYDYSNILPAEQKANLSPEEQIFFNKYNENLDTYMESLGDLDLTTDLLPPKELYIEVRCERDYGEIQTAPTPNTIGQWFGLSAR